jgi:hypothetical protein
VRTSKTQSAFAQLLVVSHTQRLDSIGVCATAGSLSHSAVEGEVPDEMRWPGPLARGICSRLVTYRLTLQGFTEGEKNQIHRGGGDYLRKRAAQLKV